VNLGAKSLLVMCRFALTQTLSPARAKVAEGEMVIMLDAPLLGVSPGQSAVIYVGTRVVGQCTIDRTVSALAPAHA